jgi:TonB-linked SusC/RagA family outer membrane protein
MVAIPLNAQQPQKAKKIRQMVDITMKVVDESGNPLPKAQVTVGEGIIHTETDATGAIAFKAYPEDFVTVTLPPYEKTVVVVLDLVQNSTVKLLLSKMHMTSDDNVPLPFTTLKRRYLTGPDIVMDGSKFEKYPSVDLRASLTGITSGFDIRELDGSPGLSSLEGLQSASGIGNGYGATDKFSNVPLIIVDGMPASLQEYPLDAAEIESATWMKGILSTAMFGPQANGGALYIVTKRGAKNERMLNVDIENGVGMIDRMPGWVDGAEYATLNNQARTNSGLTPVYSQAAIAKYAENNAYSLRYPSVNFRDMLLKNTKDIMKVNLSSSGGNENVQYFSYVGYAKEGDILKLGATSDYNRITARQNVNVKINDQLDVKFGFYGNLSFRRSPSYGYSSTYSSEGTDNGALTLTELPSLLADINSVPPIAFPVWAFYDTVAKVPWYGVTSNYTNNPVGNLVSQGYYTDKARTGVTNVTLNYDMGSLVKGLKSTTYLGFNIHNLVRLGKTNDYLAYIPSISAKTGNDTITKSSSHGLVTMSDLYKLMDYYFQRYSVNEVLSLNRSFGDHTIQTTLAGYWSKTFINGIEEPQRQETGVWTGMYSFKDRYTLQAVLNYSGTTSFDVGKRFGFFPSVGAGWVISEESFMSNVKVINYLKLRAQYGVIGNETFFPVLYYIDRWSQNSSGQAFGAYSSNQWFGAGTDGSVLRTSPQRIGNPNLTWEKRIEFNGGFDASLLNNKLAVEMTYTNFENRGTLIQIANTLPYSAGLNGARPWYNYTNTRYNMFTTDLRYSDKVGEIEYSIGANATVSTSKRLRYDEPANRWDYQNRTGRPSDAIFGQTYLGKLTAADLADPLTPRQTFDDVLAAGDLKYADLNGDKIVDDNDQSMIGHSSPRLFYGINVSVKYKNFELYVLGNGRAFYDVALTNSYYWNGWSTSTGDNTYSDFVRDNVGGAYPRLTYNKVNNNFITSAFWLEKGGYFKIQNVELSYTIPAKYLEVIGSRGIKIYVRGANLLTLSKVKDVDPESLNSGVSVYPLFKTFTGGVKFNF